MDAAMPKKINEKEFSNRCRELVVQRIRKDEGVNDEDKHLRVIRYKSCRSLFDPLPYRWKVLAAVILEHDRRRGYVKFVGYTGRLTADVYDPTKPLEEQLKIEKDSEPVLDLYAKLGDIEKDIMPIRLLRRLADELEEKFALGSAEYEKWFK